MTRRSAAPLMWLALLPLLGASSGCEVAEGKSCTEVGCQSGFTLAFQNSAWPAGTYTVQAVTAAGPRTCSVVLPFSDISPAVTCSGGAMQLGTSGSALPAAQHSLVGITLPDLPAQVTVTVKRDDKTLASQAFTPAYKTSQPNGAGCEPTCTQAAATLSW